MTEKRNHLDPHWLKEKYKELTDQELSESHFQSSVFEEENEVKMFKAEIERREKERHGPNS